MSPRKLHFALAVAASLALGACAWHETKTETVSTETHMINGSPMASSSDMNSNTGATSSMGATGSTGVTRSRTLERSSADNEWHVVR